MRQIPLPDRVRTIIERLSRHGYEAYAVGGCVRDTILGRVPGDWDLTTNALPEEIKRVFSHTIDTGIAHGTVTVLIDREPFEVTTFRTDGEYLDHRHPESVTFVPDLREDLSRRDFTINAMAYSEKTGLVDFFGGMQDLAEGVIRCVGEPYERFQEDALRMLRAVRFSAQLGFQIDPATEDGIRLLHREIAFVSRERIQAELVRLLLSDHPERFRKAAETGLAEVFLPEAAELFVRTIEIGPFSVEGGDFALETIRRAPADLPIRLAALLAECRRPEGERPREFTQRILKALKFDNRTSREAAVLTELSARNVRPDAVQIRTLLCEYGGDCFRDYLKLRRARNEALRAVSGPRTAVRDYSEQEEAEVSRIRELFEEILVRGDCVSMADLAVTGQDLLARGIGPGKVIGERLKELLTMVLKDPARNNREELLSYCEREWLYSKDKGEDDGISEGL